MNKIIRQLKDSDLGKAVDTRRDCAYRNGTRRNLNTLYAGAFRTHFSSRSEETVRLLNLVYVK